MVKRRIRLTKRTDFERVRRAGKSYAHLLTVLIALPNSTKHPRFGVSAGRSVGNAVQRNRAKRRIRAVLYSVIPQIKGEWDLVFLARRPINQASFQELSGAIYELLHKAETLSEV